MMKFVVATLAVLALSSPLEAYKIPRAGTGALADELQGFMDLIPIHDMVNTLLEYVAEDEEVQKMVVYLKSDEFRALVLDIEAMPEAQHLINYIENAGVDVYYLLNKAHNFIGLPKYEPVPFSFYKTKTGIRGLLDEVEAMLPVEQIKAWYRKEMATSKVFADFMAELRKPEIQEMANKTVANVHFQALLVKAKNAGIDIETVKRFLSTLLGLKFPQ